MMIKNKQFNDKVKSELTGKVNNEVPDSFIDKTI